MPVRDQIIHLEKDSERLGVLWRSQGNEFLAQQEAEIWADVARLRAAYVKRAAATIAPAARSTSSRDHRKLGAAPRTIDLRDKSVAGIACSRHGNHAASDRCRRCNDAFCAACIVHPEATHGDPLCTACALVMGGVRHRRPRPLVAPGHGR
jgi:hypothetical protein